MKPVIAMPKMENSLLRHYMISKYIASLRRAGAKVVRIPLKNLENRKEQLLACDGLLLPGGADIQPHLYGQAPTEKCGKVEPPRDEGEWAMLDAFLPTGKPILCICRGVQLMNVYCGGTLHQDIVEITRCKHSDFPNRARSVHNVILNPGTKLKEILDAGSCAVNSMHHQAADRIGEGLTVSAVSEDGIVEGLEKQNHPFFLGVQWHPEHMSARNAQQRRIFEAFVTAAKQKKVENIL